ncbi:MAG: ATP-binding protein [Magnetococcus sp. DMHC-6]
MNKVFRPFSNKNNNITEKLMLVNGLIVVLLGVLVLFGWYTHNLLLIQVYPNLVPMQYNTAFGFIFCGSALISFWFNRFGLACLFGIGVVMLAGVTLVAYVFDLPGINQIFMEYPMSVNTANISRMPPNTALSFIFMGIGIVSDWALGRYKNRYFVMGILGALVVAQGIVALVGYIVGLESIYAWGYMPKMALHSAFGFVMLGSGLIALAWSREVKKITLYPVWFSIVVGIGTVAITLSLWHSYHFVDSNTNNPFDNFSLKNAHDALLIIGFILSGFLVLTLHYNQIVRQQFIQLQGEDHQKLRLLQTKSVLNDLLQLATETHSLEELLEIALDIILTHIWIPTLKKGAIFLNEEGSGEVVLCSQRGLGDPVLKSCGRVSSGECLCGRVLETGKIIFSDSTDVRHTRHFREMKPHGHYCVPIHFGTRLLGVFNIYLPVEHVESEEEKEFLGIIANTLAKIIEQKQSEKTLAEKQAFIDNILHSSPDLAFAATDLNFYITYYNTVAERIFGYTKEQVIGRNVLDIHARECVAPERFKKAVEIVRRTGVYHYVVEQEKNGETRIISSKVSGILDQKREFIGFVLVSEDVTEQKRMENGLRIARIRAEEANRTKSHFLAAMSHEIRTPMNAILGMGEVLKESGLNEEQSDYLKVLIHAGENLLALINDILDLSKVEAGQLMLEALSFDLQELAVGTWRILRNTALTKGLVFDCLVKPDCPRFVVGDPSRLRQILLNLLGNAIKFTEQGRVVLLLESGDQDYIKFSISDTGIGIKESQIEDIFEPFRQADGAVSRRYGGTGLGLSICKQLIHAMGGIIQVESAVGKGSVFRFTVRLPRSELSISDGVLKKVIRDDHREIKQPMAQSVMNILLVDDADDNRLLIHAYLKNTPYQITEAVNGQEGVRKFQSGTFDLVFMDMQMPVLDGFGATEQIRQWEKDQGRANTPIIALTADAMKEDVEKTMMVGCDLHLSKPIRKLHLLDVIRQFVK